MMDALNEDDATIFEIYSMIIFLKNERVAYDHRCQNWI